MERTATFGACQIGTQSILHINIPRFGGMRHSAAANVAKSSLAPVFRKQTAPRAASRSALGTYS